MNETTQLPGFREAFYRRERRSIPLVRTFVREALVDWACEVPMGDVLLCVSELATNALIHGVPPGRGFRIHLYWERAEGRLRIEMHDSGGGEVAAVRCPAPDAEGGRGLMLVSALAAAWGVGERNPGKVVWCEFAASARIFAVRDGSAHSLP
ncbi:histidine kinase-like protein [Streptomyces sp. 840.1]|uniref:ATP-binding protein n=1 Tax=Streptomyces sp. 840.1 TaxID=2485152 RepID=UPI000F48F1A0|nr:ATP-binding protein [Streptomyces sp. 840.1]ROQ65797.1 histidine kinase-like protein [Streptomyces sp. 840.1]